MPICTINFADPTDAVRHARMVALVEQMLALHQRRAAAAPRTSKACSPHRLPRRIGRWRLALCRLVYALYGLSEEEVRIVEGG